MSGTRLLAALALIVPLVLASSPAKAEDPRFDLLYEMDEGLTAWCGSANEFVAAAQGMRRSSQRGVHFVHGAPRVLTVRIHAEGEGARLTAGVDGVLLAEARSWLRPACRDARRELIEALSARFSNVDETNPTPAGEVPEPPPPAAAHDVTPRVPTVRISVVGEVGMTLYIVTGTRIVHRTSGATGFGGRRMRRVNVRTFSVVCTAPCTADVPSGEQQWGVARPGGRVESVGGPVAVPDGAQLRLYRYAPRRGGRRIELLGVRAPVVNEPATGRGGSL